MARQEVTVTFVAGGGESSAGGTHASLLQLLGGGIGGPNSLQRVVAFAMPRTSPRQRRGAHRLLQAGRRMQRLPAA